MYTGQYDKDGDGLTQDVVLCLTEGLTHQAHNFFTDNFYTSRALATSLL